ncbi:hypothetical protein [Rheinheimera sp.]|uniref:hypothetical protein n=1 Tax=Rheinheimera sp. TaxID=1869214 RepID=UPI002FDD57D9
MEANLLISNKKVAYLLGGLILAYVGAILSMLIGKDELVLQTFLEINESTPYTLESEEGVTNGQLGKFFNCLNNYRSINQLQVKDGRSVRAKLYISNYKYLKLLIVDNEAYRFYIVHAEEGLDVMKNKVFQRTQDSDSYAINCDLGLLNQLEPDN